MLLPNVILNEADLKEAVKYFRQQDSFIFDVEATGDYRGVPHLASVTWMSLATKGHCIVVPFGHPIGELTGTRKEPRKYESGKKTGQTYNKNVPVYSPPPVQLDRGTVFSILEPLFADPEITKGGHDVVYDLTSVAKYLGFVPSPPYFCTKVGYWLIDENQKQLGLKLLTKRRHGIEYDTENVGKQVEIFPFSTVAYYSYCDSKYDYLHMNWIRKQLEQQGLMKVFNMEMNLLNTMIGMRLVGARVDVARLRELKDTLTEELIDQEMAIYTAAGKKFNVNSSKQKQEILYVPKPAGQGLKPWKLTQGGKKKEKLGQPLSISDYSVDDEVLSGFTENSVACAIREYSDTQKLLSTYVNGYLGDDDKPCIIYDGHIHAGFMQYGTVTGRFSCVSADSLIETPRDISKFPNGIPITDIKEGDWVYAFDHKRELRLRKVKWCGQTGVKRTLIITAENSEGHKKKLRITPEHLVMLRNGDWRPSEYLMHSPGELRRSRKPQIMTMVRRNIDDGYIKFFPNAQAKGNGSRGGGNNREHRWIMSEVLGKNLSTKYDVDHIDGNKLNNNTANLRYVPSSEHRGNRTDFAWGVKQPEIELYSGKLDYRVVSIEQGPVEPVWDMEVEELHNFIANGICVHNCRTPNLQNIPRPHSDRGKLIRGIFIAEEGGKLVVADYGQIELVVLAHYVGEGKLYEAFMQGIDPHTMTAAMVLGKRPEDVTKIERQDLGKTLGFAVVYGAGLYKVASMAKITPQRAKEVLRKHAQMFPEIHDFKQAVIDTARQREPVPYITTLLGRKRRIPELNSSVDGIRKGAERQLFNSLIQGGAADLIKKSMIRVDEILPPEVQLVLTVHDELVLSSPTELSQEAARLLEEAMTGEGIQKLVRVPLLADVKIVERWSDAK